MQNIFAAGLGPHKTYRLHRETIDRLTQAIAKKRTVQMRYFSASRLRTRRREVDPYRLWYASGGLYLVGYCHWRKEPRIFAVERMKAVTLTDHPYQMPLGFDLEAFVSWASLSWIMSSWSKTDILALPITAGRLPEPTLAA
jgi:predicted DNA-binding transcriptional regulator YafY